MTAPHPYEKHESTLLWQVLEGAIADLVENDDLHERTTRSRIVGYLAECLTKAGIRDSARDSQGTGSVPAQDSTVD